MGSIQRHQDDEGTELSAHAQWWKVIGMPNTSKYKKSTLSSANEESNHKPMEIVNILIEGATTVGM